MIKRDHDIAKELEQISPAVANLDPTLPYTVPAGYFSHLPAEILGRIREMESPEQELKDLSPLLSSLKGKTPFEVPEDYFGNISGQIMRRAGEEKRPTTATESGKLVSIAPSQRWTRLAVAAVMTAVIAGSAWYFTRTSGDEALNPAEIAANNITRASKDTLALSDEELLGFLDATEELPTHDILLADENLDQQGLALLDLNETRIQEMLEEIPDKDLQHYVSAHPETVMPGSMN